MLAAYLSDQQAVQFLLQSLQSNPSWTSLVLADGSPAACYIQGTASVSISSAPLSAADAQMLGVQDASYTLCIYVAVGTPDASSLSKIAVVATDAATAAVIAQLGNAFIGAIIARLQTGLTTLLTSSSSGTAVNGEGQAGGTTESDVGDDLNGPLDFEGVSIEVDVDVSLAEGFAVIGCGLLTLLGWALVFVAVYFALKFLSSIIFETFNVVLIVYNITSQTLSTSIQYTYNISSSEVGSINQNVLFPVSSIGNCPLAGFQPTDPIIYCGSFTLTNDSEFEGLGILMELSNVSPSGDPELSNVLLTLDVPYLGSNSMSAWFNDPDTDWGSMWESRNGENAVLATSTSSGAYVALLSTNYTHEAPGQQYIVSAIIGDQPTLSAFSTYAGTASEMSWRHAAVVRDPGDRPATLKALLARNPLPPRPPLTPATLFAGGATTV